MTAIQTVVRSNHSLYRVIIIWVFSFAQYKKILKAFFFSVTPTGIAIAVGADDTSCTTDYLIVNFCSYFHVLIYLINS